MHGDIITQSSKHAKDLEEGGLKVIVPSEAIRLVNLASRQLDVEIGLHTSDFVNIEVQGVPSKMPDQTSSLKKPDMEQSPTRLLRS